MMRRERTYALVVGGSLARPLGLVAFRDVVEELVDAVRGDEPGTRR